MTTLRRLAALYCGGGLAEPPCLTVGELQAADGRRIEPVERPRLAVRRSRTWRS